MAHPLVRSEPLRAWRIEDLRNTPDDGYRYEIFDGSLVVTSLPVLPHAATVYRLRRALEAQASTQIVVGESLGVTGRGDTFFFVPDLVLFDAALLGTDLEALPPAAARLVIEVVSPRNRGNDEVLKRYGYAVAGVAEYWIVDARAQQITVLTQPAPDGFAVEEKHSGEMRGTVPFPYRPDLDEIFA